MTNLPEVKNFQDILQRAKDKTSGKPLRAALAVPSAPEWLLALDRAVKDGLVTPTLVGDEALCRKHMEEHGVELADATFLDLNQPDMAIVTAAQMAARGEIDLIVKGRGPTVPFLRLLMQKDSGFRVKGKLITHVAVLKPEAYSKLLFVSDAAVVPQPDLVAKLNMIGNIAGLCKAVGVENPRVAVLAAVEAIYPQMKATTDGAVLAKMSSRGQIKGCQVDGPLSFDIAIDLEAAHSKGIKDSAVAGYADAMIAPSIETANGIYKAASLFCNSETGGLLVGGRVPVALGNKWDSPETRFNAIALAVLAA